MNADEEFLELCASATAGELSAGEQAWLDAHLVKCPDCRRVMSEYEAVVRTGMPALMRDFATKDEAVDEAWSVENAEKAFFKRLDKETSDGESKRTQFDPLNQPNRGKRFTYRPSQIRWQEIWMPFAAAVLLALALGVAAYRTGVKRGTDVAQIIPQPAKGPGGSLEERASDAGYERAQLEARLAENGKAIEDLKHQLAEQIRVVNSLKSGDGVTRTTGSQESPLTSDTRTMRSEELAAAQVKLGELQNTVVAATAQRDENAHQAAVLEAKVNELTQLVRE